MAKQNTSLNFKTEKQSLWSSGPGLQIQIDTGDTLVYDPNEVTTNFSFDAGIFDVDITAYLDVAFGLRAWANLGSAGVWGAEYEIDVNVDLPNAIRSGDLDDNPLDPVAGGHADHFANMKFDFSDYTVVSAKIGSAGFGRGTKGIGAGLDLVLQIKAGFRDITLETWIKDFNFGGFTLIDFSDDGKPKDINLVKVTDKNPELEIDLTDNIKLILRLPQGADTKGTSTTGVIEGAGHSPERFLELKADLDGLLTSILSKIPLPPVVAVAKFLEEVVFAEHSFDLGDYISVLPDDKIKFLFTMLDITAGVGLVITEEVKLDINKLDTAEGVTDLDIIVRLISDNGTPDNASDDIPKSGFLGDVISIEAPHHSVVGHALISAEFEINRGHFSHEVGLGLNASIVRLRMLWN